MNLFPPQSIMCFYIGLSVNFQAATVINLLFVSVQISVAPIFYTLSSRLETQQ